MHERDPNTSRGTIHLNYTAPYGNDPTSYALKGLRLPVNRTVEARLASVCDRELERARDRAFTLGYEIAAAGEGYSNFGHEWEGLPTLRALQHYGLEPYWCEGWAYGRRAWHDAARRTRAALRAAGAELDGERRENQQAAEAVAWRAG